MGRVFVFRPRVVPSMGWRRWVAAGTALVALGCSSDPSAGSAGGGTGEGGSPGGAGGSGGAGGAGGAGGVAGAEVAPVIASVTTDITKVTAFPTTVTFSAQVSDPQGLDDIAGGELHQGPGNVYGQFEPSDDAGGYQLAFTLGDDEGWSEMAYVTFLVTFRDQSGNEAEKAKVLQLDIGGCSRMPDYDTCRACYCDADPAGCASYTSREYNHLYCGNACSQTCSAFCETVYDGQPDPLLIDPLCEACRPSPEDVEAFQDSCLADIPDCFGFLVDMGHCPP